MKFWLDSLLFANRRHLASLFYDWLKVLVGESYMQTRLWSMLDYSWSSTVRISVKYIVE